MVSEPAKYLLQHSENFDPKLICKITGDDEQECWEYLADLDTELNRLAKLSDEQAVRSQARDWAFSLAEANQIKRQVLLEKLKAAKQERNQAKIEGLLKAFRVLTERTETISPEQIERARAFPITELIEHRRMMAKCPFHPDQTASMYLKNNFFHCFSCKESGDVIKFVMKRDGLSFKEAVCHLS